MVSLRKQTPWLCHAQATLLATVFVSPPDFPRDFPWQASHSQPPNESDCYHKGSCGAISALSIGSPCARARARSLLYIGGAESARYNYMPRPTSLRLTKGEKYQLARFGCFLRASEQTYYIDWSWPNLPKAKSARVVVRFIPATEEGVSLLCVAFEVSPVWFLPRYSFCPLNLTNRTHRNTLESILKSGQIPIRFVQQSRCVPRVLSLSKAEVVRSRDLYSRALNRVGDKKADRAAFNAALREFEWSGRAPQYFPWFLSESEIELSTGYLKGRKSNLPAEQIRKWELLTNRTCAVLREKYGSRIAKWIGDIPLALFALHFIHDVNQALGHDPDRLAEFLSGLYLPEVAHVDAEEYEWLPDAVESFCGLLSKVEDSPSEKRAELLISIARAATKFWGKLSAEGRISARTFLESLSPIKPLIAGKPGRPLVGYSRALELKRVKKFSWSQTAQRFYDGSSQLQAAFGKPRFVDLSFEEQHRVIENVRHGVSRIEKAHGRADTRE